LIVIVQLCARKTAVTPFIKKRYVFRIFIDPSFVHGVWATFLLASVLIIAEQRQHLHNRLRCGIEGLHPPEASDIHLGLFSWVSFFQARGPYPLRLSVVFRPVPCFPRA